MILGFLQEGAPGNKKSPGACCYWLIRRLRIGPTILDPPSTPARLSFRNEGCHFLMTKGIEQTHDTMTRNILEQRLVIHMGYIDRDTLVQIGNGIRDFF
jgi:hypothetical protein